MIWSYRMNRRHAIFLVAIAIFGFLVGCQGDEGPSNPEPPVPTEVTLSATSAPAGARLLITGLPDDASGIYGIVTPVGAAAEIDTTGATGYAYIMPAPDQKNYLVVPLHPLTPKSGGPVTIQFVGGDKITSVSVPLTLEPLAAAPGAFRDLVDSVQLLLDGWLAQLGTTRQAIREAEVGDLTFMEITTLFVHNLIDNPDNQNSLRAMADGDIPDFAGLDFDRELLDSIAALSNLQSMVDDKLEFVGGLESVTPLLPKTTFGAKSRTGSEAGCIEPPDFDIGPDDCALLSEIMIYQTSLEVARTSAVERFKNDLIGAALSAASFTGGAAIATGLGSTFWAIDSIDQGQRGMYPSEFISEATDFQVDVETFAEDFVSPGYWSEFKVSAVSEGWRFDDNIIEAFQQMIGAAGGLDPAGIGGLDDLESALENSIKGGPNAALKAKLLENRPGKLEYCSRTWTDIDCTGLPYSSATSSSLIYDSDEKSYEPVETGSANLLVETMPVFGPGKITGETKVIKTEPLEVFIDPFQATLDVSTQRQFLARVANAEDQQVSWSIVGANMSDTPTSAIVMTPDLPWETPILLTAKSLANTGLREGKVDSDPRTKTALITYSGVVGMVLTPLSVCIAPGATQQFTAEAYGLEEGYTLVWDVKSGSGSIDQNGLYQANSGEPSTAVIEVHVEGAADISAEAEVLAGDCNCRMDITVTGDLIWERSSDAAAYRVLWSGEYGYQFFFNNGSDPNEYQITAFVGVGEEPQAGDIGTWPANFNLNSDSDNWYGVWDNGENVIYGVSLTITTLTEDLMVGRFQGNVYQTGEDYELTATATVDLPFRAKLYADGGWPCE